MIDINNNIEIKLLTKEIICSNIDSFVELSKQLNGDYWTLENYLVDLDGKWDLSRVVYCNYIIIGFIIVSEKLDSLHINRIVINKSFQNLGIGKLLLDKVINEASRFKKNAISLKVNTENTNALSFYKNINFNIIETQGNLFLMKKYIFK